MVLIPQVKEKLDLPLIAAGGFATGSGMLAAFSLGAEGIQMGTRFALTAESSASDAFKNKCIQLNEGDTMLALKKLVPTRLIKNEFYDCIAKAEDNGATAEKLREILGKGRAMKGIFEGNLIEGELEIGQIASLIHDLPPVQDVMEQIVSEYNKRIGELQTL